jgi:molybdopterin molybdotransferase
VISEIAAGAQPSTVVTAGTCARIFTGSPLPAGVDAIVMQEDTSRTGSTVMFNEPVRAWENVRLRGEDVKAGAQILRAGDRVGIGAVALLGALGFADVAVHRVPTVGLVATGNELQEPGTSLRSGNIYESNRCALAALIRGTGARVRIFPIVPDNLAATTAALKGAFEVSDVVVTSGGVSVGEFDFVKDAVQALGGKLDFWRVAIRPGKPFVFGTVGAKHLFGLPGNPVSAVVTALLLVWPALMRAQGARETEPPSHPAIAADEFRNKTDRLHFMRVRIDGNGRAHLAGLQASHALSSLAAANGVLPVPAGAIFEREAAIRVIPFPW